MTDKKLSQLPRGTAVTDEDLFYSARAEANGTYSQVGLPAGLFRTFVLAQGDVGIAVTVITYGADPTGVASSVAGFQAAIDATPNSGVQVIHVPRGTYAGDMSTLVYGSRQVLWDEDATVTYSGTAPTLTHSTRQFTVRSGDLARPFIEGRIGYHSGTGQTAATDFAGVRVDRLADYTGTATNPSHGLRVATTVSNTVGAPGFNTPEWALTATITSDSPNCNAVANTGIAFRNAGVDGACWAGQFSATDNNTSTTGLTRVVRGAELNIAAGGLDNTNTRCVVDCIAHNLTTSYTGLDSIGFGVRVLAATADFKFGYVTQSLGSAKVQVGFQNNASGTTGFNDIGIWTGTAFNISSNAAIGLNLSGGVFSTIAMRLGTDKKIGLTNSDTVWIGYTTASAGVEIGSASIVALPNGRFGVGVTPTAAQWIKLGASTTVTAQLNLPTGSAPTTPNDGDVWRQTNTITGLKIRVNGVTRTVAMAAREQRLVTASPITIDSGGVNTDQIINCNLTVGSPTCTLPLASTRAGVPLTFYDVGGQFAAHNLTLIPTGPDQIDGMSSLVLSTNYGGVTLVPLNDGTSTGWFVT